MVYQIQGGRIPYPYFYFSCSLKHVTWDQEIHFEEDVSTEMTAVFKIPVNCNAYITVIPVTVRLKYPYL